MPDVTILASAAYTDNRAKEERDGLPVEYDIDEKGSVYGDDKKEGVKTAVHPVGEEEVQWAGGAELLEAKGLVSSSSLAIPLVPQLTFLLAFFAEMTTIPSIETSR